MRHLPDAPAPLAATAAYYRATLAAHGSGPRAMDWNDAASQRLRLVILLELLAFTSPRDPPAAEPPSLLDVGCGDGELLAHCQEAGLAVRYHGIDICPEMVAACERRFGSGTAELADTSTLLAQGASYDYVLASGTFNVRQATATATWAAYVERTVEEMYRLCRSATAFNALTTILDVRRDHLYYLDPATIARLAERCGTRAFALRHDYPLFELSVGLYRGRRQARPGTIG